MTQYVLTLLGVIILGVVIETILPNGEMNKFIRAMYSIFVIFIIISPVTNLVKNGFDISNFVKENTVEVDGGLLDYIYEEKIKELENIIFKKCAEEGFENVLSKIKYSINGFKLDIINVTINLDKLVIKSHNQHINKYEKIKIILTDILRIKEEQIIFDE